MTIKLYNTLTRSKQELQPINARQVGMYVCGPTVYDYAHIGNARPIIVFDVLFRLLRHEYGADHVRYVRNITDVDDKINARAAQEGVSIGEVTARTIEQFHKDITALGVLPPTIEPRATDHIAEMIAMIETLIARGHAYAADSHVLFDVPSMPDYGKLSNRTLDEMKAGARVEVASYKKDPTDFVLWKPSVAGEPSWPSPWGDGRPGWHIECSAMSKKHLGETFDIHGGGLDLIFPHHENEIAQSRCAHDCAAMANIWMHNGFLQVEGEKMSKSLGNFITINELLTTTKFGGRQWPGEVLRLAMLMTHYKEPIDFTVKRLKEAENILTKLYRRFDAIWPVKPDIPDDRVIKVLFDDLNTSAAVNILHWSLNDGSVGQAMTGFTPLGYSFEKHAGHVLGAARLMGLLHADPQTWLQGEVVDDQQKIDELIAARAGARAAKDWAEGDRIRDELSEMGVQLKDSKNKETGEIVTTWEMKR